MPPQLVVITAIVLLVTSCSAVTTSLFKYTLQDSSLNTNYPEGSNEYHCFDIDVGGRKQYVRGSYGYYGYFEGSVDPSDPQVFHVNWWETSVGAMLPTSGASTITYSEAFDTITGPYWLSGSSDMLNSYGQWHSTNGVMVTTDDTPTGKHTILTKCLYPGASTAIPRTAVTALNQTIAVTATADVGTVVLCAMPAGPALGSWLGTYTYIYGDDDGGGTEDGNYGTNPFAFWATSGMGFVSQWRASTGGYAGTLGSNLYMVVADTAKTYLVGFYCNVDAHMVQTECFTEYYEVSASNVNADNCPAFYKMDGTLDGLYQFASTGSALAPSGGGSIDSPAPGVMFVCGLLTAVLLYLAYQCLIAHGHVDQLQQRKHLLQETEEERACELRNHAEA